MRSQRDIFSFVLHLIYEIVSFASNNPNADGIKCMPVVSPVHQQWRYHSLALSTQYTYFNTGMHDFQAYHTFQSCYSNFRFLILWIILNKMLLIRRHFPKWPWRSFTILQHFIGSWNRHDKDRPSRTYKLTCYSCSLFNIMPADALATHVARASAGMVLTNMAGILQLSLCTFIYHWAPSQYKDRLIYVWRFPC